MDIKNLEIEELNNLSKDIRDRILEVVSKNGYKKFRDRRT